MLVVVVEVCVPRPLPVFFGTVWGTYLGIHIVTIHNVADVRLSLPKLAISNTSSSWTRERYPLPTE